MATATREGGYYLDAEGNPKDAHGDPIEETGADELPSDFPGRTYLESDGRFTSPEAVRSASDDDLDSVDGIGPATLEEIRAYE